MPLEKTWSLADLTETRGETMGDGRDVPTYIGRCQHCRQIVFAAVDDDGTNPKELAKAVADLLKRGRVLERSTVGFVRDSNPGDWMCVCEPAPKRRKARAQPAHQGALDV